MLKRNAMRAGIAAATLLSLAAAKPLLPAPLLPLSEADMTTGESGCESSFTQGNTSYVYVQNSSLILRTAPGATGRKLCRLTQAQQGDFGSGPATASCGGLKLSIRPTGRGSAHPEADSSDSPAALMLSDGTHSRVVRGTYGTACAEMILPFLLLAQVTPMQPMPRGTGLPPVVAEAQDDAPAVLATVNALFQALTARDLVRAATFFRPDGGAQAVVEQPDGTRAYRHESWPQFLARIPASGPRFVEAISDPAIEVDGDIATVWAPYTVTVDSRLVHCGTDHFDLVRESGQWKILNITWTQRTTGCAAQ